MKRMKRNTKQSKLLKKALSLGLAAAVAVTSMGPALGMLSPMVAQAENLAASGGSFNASDYYEITDSGVIEDGSGNFVNIYDGGTILVSDITVAAKGNNPTTIGAVTSDTVKWKKADTEAEPGTENIEASGKYTVSFDTTALDNANKTGDFVDLSGETEKAMATLNLIVCPKMTDGIKYAYSAEEGGEAKDYEGTTPIPASGAGVIISAADCQVSDNFDTISDGNAADNATYPFTKKGEADGTQTKILYFAKEGTVSASKVEVCFDTAAPVIENVSNDAGAVTTVSAITGENDSLTATINVGLTDESKTNETGDVTYTLKCTTPAKGAENHVADTAHISNKTGSASFTLSGLKNNTAYTFSAVAMDEVGNVSDAKEITFTTPKKKGAVADKPSVDGDIKDNAEQMAFIVTLKEQSGAMYRINKNDAGKWQSSNVFTINADDITDNKVTFGVYIPGDGTTTEDGDEVTAEIPINKITQEQPSLNYTVEAGEGDERIVTISEVEGAVYSFSADDNESWSEKGASGTPNVSTGLTTANTSVKIGIKYPASKTRSESTAATKEINLGQSIADKPAEGTYAVNGGVPDINIDSPTYTVTVTATPGAAVYEYSFDGGNTWSTEASKAYAASDDKQQKTIYIRNNPDGSLPSAGVSINIEIPALIVKNPTINGTASFTGSTQVTITCGTTGAKILYTTNGEAPTSGSIVYNGPITLTDTTTVKAFAVNDGMKSSGAVEKAFTKNSETQGGGGGSDQSGDSGSGGNSGSSSSGGSSTSGSGSSSSGGSGATSGSTGSGSSAPTTTTNPDGSTTTTTTTTKSDGTKVTTSTTTATDGSKTETVTETKKDGTTTETTTETKTDGTKTESVVETAKDGSKTESTTETRPDGSKTESVTEKAADGSVVKSSETVTASDGSAVKTETENTRNTAGNDAAVTITTETDTTGAVTSVTKKIEIPESSDNTSTVVTVKKDGTGDVTSAKAAVENTVSSGNKATLSAEVVSQITEAAGTDSVSITMTVKDEEGNVKYKVKADTEDLEGGNKLYIYKLNTETGKYVMVDAKTYTVSSSGNVSISMTKKATYELVDKKEAAKINKEIKASITPKKAAANLKSGKKASFKLSSKADEENIKSITYTTSNKKVAAVSKNGKITAKKGGTVTVKAKVTLLNGSTKIIKMKVKVKK